MLTKTKRYIAVIVMVIFVVLGLVCSKQHADMPISEDELRQLQTLLSERMKLDQVLSQTGYTKSEGISPTYYKLEGHGQHNILVNIKLDKQFWYDGNECYFHSDKSGAPEVEWGHTLILSYEGVEIFMRELSSNKQTELINNEINLLLTSMPEE